MAVLVVVVVKTAQVGDALTAESDVTLWSAANHAAVGFAEDAQRFVGVRGSAVRQLIEAVA